MKTALGIFQGKQKTYNIYLLETLYDNGPLTAWEMTKDARTGNRMSLHATYNKRLHSLEKKGYVRKAGRFWSLQFKGIIAVMLIQPRPKPWSEKWTELIEEYAKDLEEKTKQMTNISFLVDGKRVNPIKVVKRSTVALRRFESWLGFANEVKRLMENGVINLDVIKNKTLLAIILTQTSQGILDEALGE